MAGVDFDKDFPQPPAGKPAEGAAPARRISFRNDKAVVLELLHPLIVEGEPPIEIDRLTIRRVTAEEVVAIVDELGEGAEDATLLRHVTAATAGIDVEILGALSPDDAGRVAAAALPFLPAGLVAAIERLEADPVEEADDAD